VTNVPKQPVPQTELSRGTEHLTDMDEGGWITYLQAYLIAGWVVTPGSLAERVARRDSYAGGAGVREHLRPQVFAAAQIGVDAEIDLARADTIETESAQCIRLGVEFDRLAFPPAINHSVGDRIAPCVQDPARDGKIRPGAASTFRH